VIYFKEDDNDEEGTVRSLLKQLLESEKREKQNRTLSNVRVLLLKGDDSHDSTTIPTGLLANLYQACTHLEQMISASCVINLKSFASSSK